MFRMNIDHGIDGNEDDDDNDADDDDDINNDNNNNNNNNNNCYNNNNIDITATTSTTAPTITVTRIITKEVSEACLARNGRFTGLKSLVYKVSDSLWHILWLVYYILANIVP